MNSLKLSLTALVWVVGVGCNGPIGFPGVFKGAGGSCTAPATKGYIACEDYLGTDDDADVGASLCRNFTMGNWSPDRCPITGTLGTCLVQPLGTGDAQTRQYTYLAAPDGDAGSATQLTAETACGLAGGQFSPPGA